jgi:hypothetical protein
MALANSNVLQEVFGYPPDNLEERTNIMIRKSMPVVEFRPSTPQFQNGLDLFTIMPAWIQYSELLKDNGFITPNNGTIKLAFLADNFPTDTFTNEYGENFLQKFTDVASEGAASIAQMFGAESATQVFGGVQKQMQSSENMAAKGIGKGMEWLGDTASAAHNALSKVGSIGKFAANSVSLVDRLAAGSRIDFPMVWKSSGFQPSYSFTIRLYNPWPQDPDYTNKYIIGPIVAIMLLGVPRSQDSSTFTWPFLHQITCPGLFDLNPGFISNITVVKGGDQQQIAFQQRMGIVDVRIDVGSLYSSMLAGDNNVTSTRPTVKKYAEILAGGKQVSSRVADNNRYVNKIGDGPEGGRSVGFISKTDEQDFLTKNGTLANFTSNPTAGRQRQATSPKIHADDTGSPSIVERVSTTAKQTYAQLLAQLGL